MRQMPQGQWVAFEGYDNVHECSKEYSENHLNSSSKTYGVRTGYNSRLSHSSNAPENSSGWSILIWIFVIAALLWLFGR
jgi:hypothetical protein